MNIYKKKKIEVTKNRNILQRVIDVVKLIGKKGLSYRGHRNEAANSLNDSTLDHGNFLDILLLLKKYDVVLSKHIGSITKNASDNHKRGKGKGRGASLTFISKTIVNMVIDSISYLMKKSISDDIRYAVMFSVQLDTTQDISVQDQCSIIVRYVNYKGIQEKLLAVITVQQSSGKSLSDMLQSVLLTIVLILRNVSEMQLTGLQTCKENSMVFLHGLKSQHIIKIMFGATHIF